MIYVNIDFKVGDTSMKWNEIPKYKEYGLSSFIEYGFIYYINFIEDEIKENNLQMNPDFQRGHIWTEEQQSKYIEFILRGGKSGRDFYFNWNHYTNEYVCVDGLQRTIAFKKFVDNELKVFNQYFNEFNFGKYVANYNPLPEFKIKVFINDLSSNKEILQWYIDMNAGGTPHSQEEIDRVKKMLAECE